MEMKNIDRLAVIATTLQKVVEEIVELNDSDISVCTLSAEQLSYERSLGPELHLSATTFATISDGMDVAFATRPDATYPHIGYFTHAGVYFYALFSNEEMEQYDASKN